MPRPTPTGEAEAAVSAPAEKKWDLTVNKVLAGAGAAATSAVLGSFFGAAGTVAGAALGSVASTLATTLYQRSLDHTRDTLVARIRPLGRGGAAVGPDITVPLQRVSPDAETMQLRVEPEVPTRRRWARWAGATVLVFVLALLVVTGLEWAKGSTLTSGESGTSVGRVITSGGGSGGGVTAPDEGTTTPTTTRTTTESTPTPEPSAGPTTAAPEPGTDPLDSSPPAPGGQVRPSTTSSTPTPTPAPAPAPAADASAE